MSDVIKEWRESAQYWAKHSATIYAMFAPLTQALIEHAEIREGQSVLDVAGGPGEPSLTIARAVGPNGVVTCTDVVAEMVETARAEAERRGITNVRFQQCSADDLPFADNSFDAVVCRLGVMLFPDPPAAIREMLRVTKPGGRLAFVVWHKSELNPFCYAVTNVLDQHVKSQPEDPDAPGAFRFAEPGKLANVMTKAGVVDVKEAVLKFEIAAPVSAREFWAMRSQMSDTLRSKLDQLSEEERSQVASEIEHAVQPFFPQNHMRFPAQMIIASGKKAGHR
ncbi:MAG TPA: class I SAM-dependent methyltransferase [Pyrinomonadaceae bacterium]|nr:class I SAM-dependent methyltransferase [Pyrinomonadaceae bacterium]